MLATFGNVLQLLGVVLTLTLLVLALVGLVVTVMVRFMPHDAPVAQKVVEVPQAAPAPVAVAPAPAPVAPAAAPAVAAEAKSEVAPAATAEESVDVRVMAVIAATVAAILGPGAQIRSIRQFGPEAGAGWARAGRRVLQESHNLGMRGRAR